MELAPYFRAEVETVGRRWREVLAGFDAATALRRPAPTVNHALWLTGHLAWAQDYFILELPAGRSVRPKDWDPLFDHSSEKLPDDAYPSFDEVRAAHTRIHAEALKFLGLLGAAALGKPCHAQRRWFPTVANALAHQVTHGHYHLGQLVCLDRLRAAGKL